MPHLLSLNGSPAHIAPQRWGRAVRQHCLPIIGTLLVAVMLVGCGLTRVAYNNAATVAYWWLDGYFDFDAAQSEAVRGDLDRAVAWHRQEELPRIALLLAALKVRAMQDATVEQTCQLASDAQARATVALERLVPTIATLAVKLQEPQIQQMERELDKRATKWRDEFLDVPVQERAQSRVKQIQERTEFFYGRLRPEQLAIIRARVASSAYDATVQFQEMQRRHQDAVQVLRQLRTTRPPAAQANAAIAGLLQRSAVPPEDTSRQYLARITQQGCTLMTDMHNSMDLTQRTRLAKTIQDYIDDVRALSSVN